jgi:hypothetical protein
MVGHVIILQAWSQRHTNHQYSKEERNTPPQRRKHKNNRKISAKIAQKIEQRNETEKTLKKIGNESRQWVHVWQLGKRRSFSP